MCFKKAHTIPLKAKEATIFINLFPKDKSTFYIPKTILFGNLKRENNRIRRQNSDSWTRLTQKRKSSSKLYLQRNADSFVVSTL
jgi:hypothetical protein